MNLSRVEEHKELYDLLHIHHLTFINKAMYISSEDSMEAFEFIQSFKKLNLNLEFNRELSEEQVLYKVLDLNNVLFIQGMVDILIFK